MQKTDAARRGWRESRVSDRSLKIAVSENNATLRAEKNALSGNSKWRKYLNRSGEVTENNELCWLANILIDAALRVCSYSKESSLRRRPANSSGFRKREKIKCAIGIECADSTCPLLPALIGVSTALCKDTCSREQHSSVFASDAYFV